MPARVVPDLEIDIRAKATGWAAVCPDCGWAPMPDTVDRVVAQRAAYIHNAERHDGAGVELTAGDFLDNLNERIDRCHKGHRRAEALAALGAVLLASGLLTSGADALAWFTVGASGFVLGTASYLRGVWLTRERYEGRDLRRARTLDLRGEP